MKRKKKKRNQSSEMDKAGLEVSIGFAVNESIGKTKNEKQSGFVFYFLFLVFLIFLTFKENKA